MLGQTSAQRVSQEQRQALTPLQWLGLDLLRLPINELRAAVRKEADSNPAMMLQFPKIPHSAAEDQRKRLENLAAQGESLDEHLMSQLRLDENIKGRLAELCQAIVQELEPEGYLRTPLSELAVRLNASHPDLEAARQRVMALDPLGCGAMSLTECYTAQLKGVSAAKRAAYEKAIALLTQFEKDGGRRRPTSAEIKTMNVLRSLDSAPGRLYEPRQTTVITPDIFLHTDGSIDVDQRDIPEIAISPRYVAMIRDATLDEKTRAYAAERVQHARDFRQALIKRQETVTKIAELAVGSQTDFQKGGLAAMKRQTMSEVAKKAKCSVATVSRAAARKYVKTPRGVYPLRRFFCLVDEAPLDCLRELLRANPDATDAQISELMTGKGYKMARRTVTKYRKKFGYQSQKPKNYGIIPYQFTKKGMHE